MKIDWAKLLKNKKVMIAAVTLIIVVLHGLLTTLGVNTTIYIEPLQNLLYAIVEALSGGEI